MDGMSVNHPKIFWSPIKMLELATFFGDQTVKMVEVVGSLVKQSKCWNYEGLL